MIEARSSTRNKFRTAWEILRLVKNWPLAIRMRLFRGRQIQRLLVFRDGLNVLCRQGTRDWDVVYELLFAGSYERAFNYLRAQPAPTVLDLGGNIGLFSLLAARANQNAAILSFEPGPPNYRLFEVNRLLNSALTNQIDLHKKAVGGHARTAEWFFDEANPGGSGLYSSEGEKFSVEIVKFDDLIASLPAPVTLLKLDIEGAEYEIAFESSPATWQRVEALSMEIHEDPEKKFSREQLLDRFASFGFKIEVESVCSYFLFR